jgi:hypothetical protein
MAVCFCRLILAALVILFAWVSASWSSIALTVVGVLLIILALKKDFCCTTKK